MRIFAVYFILTQSLLAWSEGPHQAITRAAIAALPAEQKALLGEQESEALGNHYCLIPDLVYTDKANAKYATLPSQPGVVYVKQLHLPEAQPQTLAMLHHFIQSAVQCIKQKQIGEALRYAGCLCHVIEDYGSPSHTLPGDNMFTLLQQFLPPSAALENQLMHGPVESGTWSLTLPDYTPTCLGTSTQEAAWRLMHRMHEGILQARSTTLPILSALYAGDKEKVTLHQLRAARMDAQIVADMLHTLLTLGSETEQTKLTSIDLSPFWPLEAPQLHYPQSEFFSSPHWGHAHSSLTLAEGKTATPLRIRLESGVVRTVEHGISAGMGKSLTFLLPRGVYSRFSVKAALHAELGLKGRVEFSVLGDSKELYNVTLNGSDPAHTISCDVSSVELLQLRLEQRGLDAKSAYAVWAEPNVSR